MAKLLHIKAGSLSGLLSREERRYELVATVEAEPAEGTIAVATCEGMPRYGAPYAYNNESNPGARCRQITPRLVPNSTTIWEVQIQYSTTLPDPQDPETQGDGLENPLLRPPEISWDGVDYQQAQEFDAAANPIVMPNGEAPITPIMADRSRQVLHIARNEPVYNPRLALQYANALNADVFWGAAPGTAMFKLPRAQCQFETMVYWRITYAIHFLDDGFDQIILNQGSYSIDPVTAAKLYPKDKFGVPSGALIPLKADGSALSDADRQNGNFSWSTFRVYRRLPFDVWHLDYSL